MPSLRIHSPSYIERGAKSARRWWTVASSWYVPGASPDSGSFSPPGLVGTPWRVACFRVSPTQAGSVPLFLQAAHALQHAIIQPADEGVSSESDDEREEEISDHPERREEQPPDIPAVEDRLSTGTVEATDATTPPDDHVSANADSLVPFDSQEELSSTPTRSEDTLPGLVEAQVPSAVPAEASGTTLPDGAPHEPDLPTVGEDLPNREEDCTDDQKTEFVVDWGQNFASDWDETSAMEIRELWAQGRYHHSETDSIVNSALRRGLNVKELRAALCILREMQSHLVSACGDGSQPLILAPTCYTGQHGGQYKLAQHLETDLEPVYRLEQGPAARPWVESDAESRQELTRTAGLPLASRGTRHAGEPRWRKCGTDRDCECTAASLDNLFTGDSANEVRASTRS